MRIFILLLLYLSLSKNSLKTHTQKIQHKLQSNQNDKTSQDAKPSLNSSISFTNQNNQNLRKTQITQTNQNLLTNLLPNEFGDGKHSFKQIHNIFKSRSMSFMEIKSIFQQMDTNNDNFISDYDWIQFYNLFLDPFQKCLKSEDYTLSPQDLLECIESSQYLQNLEHLSTLVQIQTLVFNLNNKVVTLHDYIWLRRVNKAYQDCAENMMLAPNKIYCALKITSPRTARMSPVQEKGLFQVAVRLMDGYENGLRTGLYLEDFVLIAHIYHEFNEFELSKDNLITLKDVLKATQENMLHMRYIPLYANYIFQGYQHQEMTWAAWTGSMWSLMVFQDATEQQFMTFEQFMSVIEKKRLPQKLINFMNNTIIPDIGIYEIASQRLFSNVTENEYFTQTNNILFLQKKSKLKLKDIHTSFQSHQPQQHHQNQVKQSSEINNTDIYEQQFDEPKSGFEIIFNQFDRFQNKSIHVQDWMNLMRYSFLYMYYDNQGIQDVSSENVNKNDGFYGGPRNPFPLKLSDERTFIQFTDFLSENPTFQITFKQFLSYFNYNSICEFLTQPGFDLSASFMRTEQCLHLLGFRVSQYNRLEALKGFDSQLNEQTMNYAVSYQIAMKEDIVAIRILRNDKKVFVNQDLNIKDQNKN